MFMPAMSARCVVEPAAGVVDGVLVGARAAGDQRRERHERSGARPAEALASYLAASCGCRHVEDIAWASTAATFADLHGAGDSPRPVLVPVLLVAWDQRVQRTRQQHEQRPRVGVGRATLEDAAEALADDPVDQVQHDRQDQELLAPAS